MTPQTKGNPRAWSDAAFDSFVPRPRITVSRWADANRVIPRGTSPEPDQWRTERVPYLREPMDAISDPMVERVVCMWASQVGKSEMLINILGYFVDQDPSPILFVQPSEIAMQSFSKERIEPSFRATPALRGKLSESLRDKENTIMLKQFPGGYLACAWATSSVSLASRPIRVVLFDEVDRFPDSTGRDGDPIAQAIQRTSNFPNRKIIAVSTPTIDTLSAISRMYEETDQRRLWVPCPMCGTFQVLEWAAVDYTADGIDGTHVRCVQCLGKIQERHKPSMLAACEWRPDEPINRHRGYQLSALYSPWVRWSDLAEQWVRVTADRDKRGLQEFVNLRLGEPWTEGGDQVNAESLEKNRERYVAEVPEDVVLLTCGVDTQDNRLEAEVVGWGAGKESWGVWYAIIVGDTSDVSPAGPWAKLDAFLGRTWTRADGAALIVHRACVDSGGHRTDEVYDFCKPRTPRIVPIKGRGGAQLSVPIVTGKPSIVGAQRALLYTVGGDAAKDAIFSRLSLPTPGPGYCHFPADAATGYDTEFYRGLCSERRKPKVRAGRRTVEWVQVYSRNEPLDCRTYATAAMELALLLDGVDLDKMAAARREQAAARATANGAQPAAAQPARRRILSRGIQ